MNSIIAERKRFSKI